MMDDSTHIIISMIGFFGIFVSAMFGYLTHRHAKEINDAVNHRHDKAGPSAMKLYDLAFDNHVRTRDLGLQADELVEWKRGYEGGPLDAGNKVVAFVEATEKRFKEIEEKLDS